MGKHPSKVPVTGVGKRESLWDKVGGAGRASQNRSGSPLGAGRCRGKTKSDFCLEITLDIGMHLEDATLSR